MKKKNRCVEEYELRDSQGWRPLQSKLELEVKGVGGGDERSRYM